MKVGLVQTILAVLALVLVVVNIMLSLGNQSVQAEVSERQQYIAQSIQLEQLNRQVVGALATMAMKSNDQQLKNLLVSSGVGIGPEPAAESK
jgi:predicted Holliday junction resolvase-like endonuclease